jgi:membrane fusion protein (multidrug efflux system)
VPAQAVQRNNAGGAEVFVINDEGRAVLQPVRAGPTLGTRMVIEDGLKPGYRVIVDGFQKFTPGSLVKAVPLSETDTAARAPN